MDFNKIVSGVKDAVGGQDNQNQQQQQQQQTDEQKWSDVGSSVKQALGDFQADQAKGEKPDYAEIGKVAKKAYDAYSSEDNKQDYTGIGKDIASGFMGGAKSQEQQSKPEGQQQQQQQNDGDRQ